jgi:two-component system, chemotaxis family, chemotaxis protein CheV
VVHLVEEERMASEILTEAGTNEMELLVFRMGETLYGINVAKVRELVQRIETASVPLSPDAVDGTFLLRDEVLTQVNLRKYLGTGYAAQEEPEGLLIIVELNKMRCGVLVDAVERIHRLRWDAIDPPSKYLTDTGTPVTAVAQVDDRVVLILDFETILGELLGTGGTDFGGAPPGETAPSHEGVRILMVDDSVTIRQVLERLLRNAGFDNITVCTDGQHAWDVIEEHRQGENLPFDLVLSDIEMPRMDGLHLTARIKNDPVLKDMPVVLFSSLISEENANKGRAVGADAQITKFQGEELINTIEQFMGSPAAGV